MSPQQLENFERAFSGRTSGFVRTCDCGKVFYNPSGDWDTEEGEIEALEASGATCLEYPCGTVYFEGKTYAVDCSCWHPRAEKIINWIGTHDTEIAQFLTLEKKRKIREGEESPVVE